MELYGSLTNRIMESAGQKKPEVGMGVTETMWSDRDPWEVIEVADDRHITVRALTATVAKGSEWPDLNYEYSSDENNVIATLFKTKSGKWVRKVGRRVVNGSGWVIGYAEKYRDPSF